MFKNLKWLIEASKRNLGVVSYVFLGILHFSCGGESTFCDPGVEASPAECSCPEDKLGTLRCNREGSAFDFCDCNCMEHAQQVCQDHIYWADSCGNIDIFSEVEVCVCGCDKEKMECNAAHDPLLDSLPSDCTDMSSCLIRKVDDCTQEQGVVKRVVWIWNQCDEQLNCKIRQSRTNYNSDNSFAGFSQRIIWVKTEAHDSDWGLVAEFDDMETCLATPAEELDFLKRMIEENWLCVHGDEPDSCLPEVAFWSCEDQGQ